MTGLQIAYPNGVEAPKGIQATAFDGVPDRQLWEQLEPQIEAHRFALPIAATFPLDRVAHAHEALAQRHALGKIVLRITNNI